MSWIRHIQSRYNQSDVIVQDRLINVEGCKVDLRNFPEPNVVLCVDRLIKEDLFVKNFTYDQNGYLRKHCDLIVLMDNMDSIDVALIEAKSGKYRIQKYISDGIDQLESSKYILDQVKHDCELKLGVTSIVGLILTPSTQRSDAMNSKAPAATVRTGMTFYHVRCSHDVWNAI